MSVPNASSPANGLPLDEIRKHAMVLARDVLVLLTEVDRLQRIEEAARRCHESARPLLWDTDGIPDFDHLDPLRIELVKLASALGAVEQTGEAQ